jgi:predicted DNA-binding transcriptional regulator AlpA
MTPPNLFADLAKIIEAASPTDLPVLCGELERLKASLWLKMTIGNQVGPADVDRLLTAEEVAERLRIPTGNVYRNARTYPFTIRQGRYLRFSEAGLDRYIKQRQGRISP